MQYYLPASVLFMIVFAFVSWQGIRKNTPLPVLITGLVMLLVLRTFSAFYTGIWNTDEAEWVSLSYTLNNCSVPYECYDAHSTGFISIMILGILDWLGIGHSYASHRMLGLLLYLVPGILLFYATVRKLYNPRIVVIVLTLLFHFFLFGAYNHDMLAYNTEYVILFFTAAVFYNYTVYRLERKRLHLFLAAVCLGIMPFAKLQSVPIVVAIVIVCLAELVAKKRYKDILLYGFSGLLPAVLIFLVFTRMGVFDDFWMMYIRSNQLLVSDYARTEGFWNKLVVFIYSQRWVSPYYIITAILVLLAWNKQGWLNIRKVEMGPLLATCAACFAAASTGWGVEHYNTLIIIPFFLVVANLFSVYKVDEWLVGRKRVNTLHASLVILTMLFIFLPELKRFRYRLYDDAYPTQHALIDYVQQQIPVNQPLCVLGWFQAVEIQVDCKRPLATRTAHNFYLLAEKQPELMRYYHRQYIEDLEKSKPILIADPTGELAKPVLLPLKNYIDSNYRFDRKFNKINVYKRITL